ncbi:hypothetical protein [Mesorhizobium sp.]|nr:hypothetical protein [Mesorhizobium sp.]
MGNQCLLRGLIQSPFDHVDDQHRRAFDLQSGKQGDQCIRYRSAVLSEPGQRLIDPRPESWVGVQESQGRRAAIRQSVQAKEGGVGQGLGQALRQSGLATA